MATIQKFEDLICWQRARMLVREVYRAMSGCRDNGFRDQIQRASVSVMSNIAEGFESGTKQEFLHYLYIAKASAGEVRAQLYAAYDVGYLNIETFRYLNNLAMDSSRLLASFIEKVKIGSKSGLQHKHGVKKDTWFADWLAQEGKVYTARGIMTPEDAAARGLAPITS